ncbi:C-terminal processing peptidase-3. Serine peptidase. MEROPS family S41A [Draconibacterium orientale]|uniref:C-terminal processing peptidase-3. Serine peptidase. MEROPS family S41A n=1 Tax=Draconibacterium orientale TaxID=1168034 RepID=A0A1H9YD80_9BACT|nr:S41 family peptidase [Draconibacterium orientale]SES66918.1 C-terminal processing peptidase-3. Serine peptidase. MEROPS family S41A [Draconibacterium orientale]
MAVTKIQHIKTIGLGLFLAIFLIGPVYTQAQNEVQENQVKFARLLRLVDGYYVDSADVNDLTEKAIVHLLEELDPHSTYISKEEVDKMNEPLKGNFEGIGISFNIYKDTLMVTTVIAEGPSEKVGLLAGDRIIEVDGKNIAGIGLKNSDVFDLLRGEKGSKVDLSIARKGEANPLEFTIERDKIPIYSLDASYMLDETTGYIKLNKFSATTTEEFLSAMSDLKQEGIQNLVLDLRNNGGGYLKSAIELADQFLTDDQLIVYTDGTNDPKRDYKATAKGSFEDGKVVVLVNEGSASASEIVSGAVQDWDRGVIIGRRSFGKGLVQKPFFLNDGSMIRLTTAHYYTPSGRCIQKPYEEGISEYRKDYANRISNGEMFNADSIHFDDELKHKTLVNGRNVYGGGGVMPDIFVPMDTSSHYAYINNLRRKRVTYNFVLDYVDLHREDMAKQYPDFDRFNDKFEITEENIEQIVAIGIEEGIEKDEESLSYLKDELKRELKALIARDVYSRNDMYKILNEDDDAILKALEVFDNQDKYAALLVTVDTVD